MEFSEKLWAWILCDYIFWYWVKLTVVCNVTEAKSNFSMQLKNIHTRRDQGTDILRTPAVAFFVLFEVWTWDLHLLRIISVFSLNVFPN